MKSTVAGKGRDNLLKEKNKIFQWNSIIDILYEGKSVKYSSATRQSVNHFMYKFLKEFSVVLGNLSGNGGLRWKYMVDHMDIENENKAKHVMKAFRDFMYKDVLCQDGVIRSEVVSYFEQGPKKIDKGIIDAKSIPGIVSSIENALAVTCVKSTYHVWSTLRDGLIELKTLLLNKQKALLKHSGSQAKLRAAERNDSVFKGRVCDDTELIHLAILFNLEGDVKPPYKVLAKKLVSLAEYQFFYMEDIEPVNRKTKHDWINGLKDGITHLGRKCIVFGYQEHIKHMHFAVVVPENCNLNDITHQRELKQVRLLIKESMRVIMKERATTHLQELVDSKVGVEAKRKQFAAGLNSLRHHLVDDVEENEVLKTWSDVSELFMYNSVDADFLLDVLKTSSRKGKTRFDAFFKICTDVLNRITEGASNRRNNITVAAYSSTVNSIAALHREVIMELRTTITDETQLAAMVPSTSYLEKQFIPRNVYDKRASRYYNRFMYKLGVSRRSLHISHPDFGYCEAVRLYLKEYGIINNEVAWYAQIDDKNKIPIGEPGHYVLATERQRATLQVINDATATAGVDHDAGASIDNAIPTVTMITQLENLTKATDSFIKDADVHIAVKSSILQASTTIRAHLEFLKLLEAKGMTGKRIGILSCDGGPEHMVKHPAVKIALILIWRQLRLNHFVAGRSCPLNSWVNEIERIMSVLNLQLYGRCFTRAPLRSRIQSTINPHASESASLLLEKRFRAAKGLKGIREAVAHDPELRHSVHESLRGVCKMLQEQFLQGHLHGKRFLSGYVGSVDEIHEYVKGVTFFNKDILTSVPLDKILVDGFGAIEGLASVKEFLETHTSSNPYMFQVAPMCWKMLALEYISTNRNPDEIEGSIHPTCKYGCYRPAGSLLKFSQFNFVPSPNKDPSQADYMTYENAIKHEDVGDKFVPSKIASIALGSKKRWSVMPVDTKNKEVPGNEICAKSKLITNITCQECGMPHAVYCSRVISTLFTKPQYAKDKLLMEEFLCEANGCYICGMDFSEAAAAVGFSEPSLRPYTMTYMSTTNIPVSCGNTLALNLYQLDTMATVCYYCGSRSCSRGYDGSLTPVCDTCTKLGVQPLSLKKVTRIKTVIGGVASDLRKKPRVDPAAVALAADDVVDLVALAPTGVATGADDVLINETDEPEQEPEEDIIIDDRAVAMQNLPVTADEAGEVSAPSAPAPSAPAPLLIAGASRAIVPPLFSGFYDDIDEGSMEIADSSTSGPVVTGCLNAVGSKRKSKTNTTIIAYPIPDQMTATSSAYSQQNFSSAAQTRRSGRAPKPSSKYSS